MNEYDLLTVKQFAAQAGISPQAVYQRLDKSLASYVVEVDGKKRLKKEALLEFQRTQEQRNIEQDSLKIEQDLVKTLQSTVSVLEAQLKAKDQQIAELNERLKEAMEISKAHVVLSVADRQQLPPTADEVQTATPENKPDLWARFKKLFE